MSPQLKVVLQEIDDSAEDLQKAIEFRSYDEELVNAYNQLVVCMTGLAEIFNEEPELVMDI